MDFLTNVAVVTALVAFICVTVQYFFNKLSSEKRAVIGFWVRQIVEAVQKQYPDNETKKKAAVDFLVEKFHVNEKIASVWVEAMLLELQGEYTLDVWRAMFSKQTATPVGFSAPIVVPSPYIPPYNVTPPPGTV